MAKAPTINELPGVAPQKKKPAPQRKKPPAQKKPPEAKQPAVEADEEKPSIAAVSITMTMVSTAPGYQSERVQLQSLPRAERNTLKRLWMGLDAAGATLEDGRPVDRPARALRFVLQQLAAAERGDTNA